MNARRPGVRVTPELRARGQGVPDEMLIRNLRERLDEIRDLHKPAMVYGLLACASCRELAPPYGWPCPTARIVYSEAEIRKATT